MDSIKSNSKHNMTQSDIIKIAENLVDLNRISKHLTTEFSLKNKILAENIQECEECNRAIK